VLLVLQEVIERKPKPLHEANGLSNFDKVFARNRKGSKVAQLSSGLEVTECCEVVDVICY